MLETLNLPAWPFRINSSPPLPDEPITEYWLVFTTSTQWVRHVLVPNFAHCYVLTRDNYNWLVLHPERLQLRAEIAPFAATDDLIALWCKPHETVLKLSFMPRHTVIRFGWWGFFSCVTLVRYILGLHSIKCVTPYQLYKKLLALSDQQRQSLRIASIELIQGSGSHEQCRQSNWWIFRRR